MNVFNRIATGFKCTKRQNVDVPAPIQTRRKNVTERTKQNFGTQKFAAVYVKRWLSVLQGTNLIPSNANVVLHE